MIIIIKSYHNSELLCHNWLFKKDPFPELSLIQNDERINYDLLDPSYISSPPSYPDCVVEVGSKIIQGDDARRFRCLTRHKEGEEIKGMINYCLAFFNSLTLSY